MKAAGLTMIEVLITLLIIGISLSALYRLHWLSMHQHRQLINGALALELTEQKMAAWQGIRSLAAYQQLAAGQETRWFEARQLELQQSWEVQEYNSPDYKVVNLEVLWQYRGETNRFNLSTIVARPHP